MRRVAFVEYNMGQLYLPEDLETLIPPRHVVRVVNAAIDRIPDAVFLRYYPGGGRSSYHPKCMTKILVYAYTQRLYTSRQIAKACRENVAFMWLAARQTPDFRTINRFRSQRLKTLVDEIFAAVLQQLVEAGYVRLEHYFVDGTKIEANANRYTFVWKKSTTHFQTRLQGQMRQLLADIDAAQVAEDATYGTRDLEELGADAALTADQVEAAVARLEARLATTPQDQPLRRVVRKFRRDLLPRARRYERQQATFGDRQSYSKTDPDATFMRMKEDHMRNGQLKPGYNVQIGTEAQFVVGFSIHQRPTDTRCLIPHLEQVQARYGVTPTTVVADAGYGSEENYAYLAQHRQQAVVKYNTYRQEATRAFRRDPRRVENWTYDAAADTWTCTAGNVLRFQRVVHRKTEAGYRIRLRAYVASDCPTCPVRAQCTRAEVRRIEVSPALLRYKQQARALLTSPPGQALAKRRMVEVESVFGQLKGNRGFRRFLLRGIPKVHIEWGLLSIAHNCLKQAARG